MDTALDTTAARHAEIRRIAGSLSGTPTPSRILAAMGHPGYGDGFATLALQTWATKLFTIHQVVYFQNNMKRAR